MDNAKILKDEIVSKNEYLEKHQGTCSYMSETFGFEYVNYIFRGENNKGSYSASLDGENSPNADCLEKACDFLIRKREYDNAVKKYKDIWLPFFQKNRDQIVNHLEELIKCTREGCSSPRHLIQGKLNLYKISSIEHGKCFGCQANCKLFDSQLQENEHSPWWYEMGLDKFEQDLPKIPEFKLYIEEN